jgi:hypothetical protein
MRIYRLSITVILLALIPIESGARDALAIWDSRCEECHGDPAEFAGKYLWDIGGQLQGQHHIDNLDLFMRNHYTPDHEIETINEMLLNCHGDAREFVEQSIWVRGNGITDMKTGADIDEFLPTHQDLQPEDIVFYRKLFARIAGKPVP